MITIRPAALADARELFEWRNDPATRAASLSSDEIDWDVHLAWFERSLAAASRLIYLADEEGRAIGMVRFDLEADDPRRAEVSINLAPAARGTGRSGGVLAAGIAAVAAAAPVRELVARIREGNVSSIRLFGAAGFEPVGEVVEGVGTYRLLLDR